MDKRAVPYKKTVFVCTRKRDGETACANSSQGGDEICRRLREEIKKAGLKGKIRVARSGCLDLCEKGPNLFLYPSGEWLCGISPDDVPAIMEKLRSDATS